MNEAARKTIALMQQGGDPRSPENISTTRAAFPVIAERFYSLHYERDTLLTIAMSGQKPLLMWTSDRETADATGFRILPAGDGVPTLWKDLPLYVRFWREAKSRISRAWDALLGRDWD